MRTHIPAGDAPTRMSSPSGSLTSILEDDPVTMEDYAVGGLPPVNSPLSDPPTYYAEPVSDTDSDSQSDWKVEIHYHLTLDGMPLFFIYVQPY